MCRVGSPGEDTRSEADVGGSPVNRYAEGGDPARKIYIARNWTNP